MSAHAHSHTGRYWAVFFALLVLTAVTVGVAQFHLAAFGAIAVAMVVAITKGSLVAAYFMHLVGEKKIIYWVLLLTLLFFLVLLLVPVLVNTTDYKI